jgi:hypothetical protein
MTRSQERAATFFALRLVRAVAMEATITPSCCQNSSAASLRGREDEHPAGHAAQLVLAKDHHRFDGLAEPHFIREQRSTAENPHHASDRFELVSVRLDAHQRSQRDELLELLRRRELMSAYRNRHLRQVDTRLPVERKQCTLRRGSRRRSEWPPERAAPESGMPRASSGPRGATPDIRGPEAGASS